MNALPEIDQSDAPEGYEWRWVPEGSGRGLDWHVTPSTVMRCRWTIGRRCPNTAVAALERGSSRRWWYYCGEHLYGRVLVDGVIYSKMLRRIEAGA